MGCAADESWNRATKARLNLAQSPAKYIGKYRPKCRWSRTHLYRQLHRSLYLDLNLDLNPSLYRAFFAKSYQSSF
jgi:hypothetical protein